MKKVVLAVLGLLAVGAFIAVPNSPPPADVDLGVFEIEPAPTCPAAQNAAWLMSATAVRRAPALPRGVVKPGKNCCGCHICDLDVCPPYC